MPPRTRSATSSPVKKAPSAPTPASTEISTEPLKLLVLPKSRSAEARILSLRHPRDGQKQRFFFCPANGLFEFTKVSASSSDLRSILLTPSSTTSSDQPEAEPRSETGYVSKAPDVFVATPFDLGFLLLPYLVPNSTSSKSLFQPLDDYLEEQLNQDGQLRYIYKHARDRCHTAVEEFCDELEAGDERMFRFSQSKLASSILRRARRLLAVGLPASLDEQFVTRSLEKPIVATKIEEEEKVVVSVKTTSEEDTGLDITESQATLVGSNSLTSEASFSSTTSTLADTSVPSDVLEWQRLRIAVNFVSWTCLPADTVAGVDQAIRTMDGIDFTVLDQWVEEVARLKREALAVRSVADFSLKRKGMDDEEAEERVEKKRKAEEEERKRKLGESRGVRDLKKVNTTGMKKMSDFFTKKASAKV